MENKLFALYSDIGGRKENEDSVNVGSFEGNLIAVVADGLGGEGCGKLASNLICEKLIRCSSNGIFPDKSEIMGFFDYANRELLKKQNKMVQMKSTAVYLCIRGNQAIWAHVGDSRLYHLYGNNICDYTLDHSASQMAVFLGLITREQIPQDAGRNRLLRAMGVPNEKPDIHDPIVMKPGLHGFLLCTDGLWEFLDDQIILEGFFASDTPQKFINYLYSIRKTRNSVDCDNNSAVAIYWRV